MVTAMALDTVKNNTVVTLSIRLLNSEGELILEDEETDYLHGGMEDIFPLVEQALDGCQVGHQIDILLEPSDGFGEYEPELIQVEDRSAIGVSDLEVGNVIYLEDPDEDFEDSVPFVVRSIEGDKVTLDPNHPLAGKTVRFQAQILSIREATPEEIEFGSSEVEDLDED